MCLYTFYMDGQGGLPVHLVCLAVHVEGVQAHHLHSHLVDLLLELVLQVDLNKLSALVRDRRQWLGNGSRLLGKLVYCCPNKA